MPQNDLKSQWTGNIQNSKQPIHQRDSCCAVIIPVYDSIIVIVQYIGINSNILIIAYMKDCYTEHYIGDF